MKRLFLFSFILVLFSAMTGFAADHEDEKPVYPKNLYKPMLGDSSKGRQLFGVHDGNRILTAFTNYGTIGEWWVGSRIRCGIYPKGSGHSYLAEFSPMVGSEVVNNNQKVIHIFSDGIGSTSLNDQHPITKEPLIFWPYAGYTGVDHTVSPAEEKIAMSDDSTTWPNHWPDRDASWDGDWNGQYGKYSRADQESYFVMNDFYNNEFPFYPDPSDTTMAGLGLKVSVRGYQWSNPAAEDILIWTYMITNMGKTNYEKVVFGMYGDADVGDDGDQKDDNADWDTTFNMVFQYDSDMKGVWGGRPAFFGFKFLESPGNPNDGIDNDGDGIIDESQSDGIDNDGDWNAETDDVGTDGIPKDDPAYPGPDVDGSEGNGVPDLGEPNFELTDNDESDQIGLTSFLADVWPNITAEEDEMLWEWTLPNTGESFNIPQQTKDLQFLYGSGYFPLYPNETRKFSIAMLFGEDADDIKRNATTMQKIYDADYAFAKAPNKPMVAAIAGDGKVTLYWDRKAEISKDHIYGYDFEGYRIYKSRDPNFLEGWSITDAWGNPTYNKPVAQFDRNNGLRGPHPVAFNGIQYDMGTDNGLQYSWTDTDVQNGQTYYYAVVSYDQGYYSDFYEKGISPLPYLPQIAPSECSKIIRTDPLGKVLSTDINTVVITPESPAAGFIFPSDLSTSDGAIEQTAGFGTGRIDVRIVDPLVVQDGWNYTIHFDSAMDTTAGSNALVYSLKNEQPVTESFIADTSWIDLGHTGLDSASVVVQNSSFQTGVDYEINYVTGQIRMLANGTMAFGSSYSIDYLYYPVFHSGLLDGELTNPIFEGMHLFVYNEEKLEIDTSKAKWVLGNCNWILDNFKEFRAGAGINYDFEIRFQGAIGDSVSRDVQYKYPSPFIIMNTSLNEEWEYVNRDGDKDKKFSSGDDIIIVRPGTGSASTRGTWQFRLSVKPDSVIIDTMVTPPDTTRIALNVDPQSGDVYSLVFIKPFDHQDSYAFRSTAAYVDNTQAKSQMDRIHVVPNPYVVVASWEPQNFFDYGRGEQKIDFIHLPQKCTIKIFTINGYLVDTIEHNGAMNDGSESWDLISKDGLEISYGVYIFHVDAPGIGEKIGKFAIIK